jgi:hypothetical protein
MRFTKVLDKIQNTSERFLLFIPFGPAGHPNFYKHLLLRPCSVFIKPNESVMY